MKASLVLSTACVALLGAAPAGFASTLYDARTLGMGGSSVGFSGNASLAHWNPAAVGVGHGAFGVYLPSVAVGIANNVLSPAAAAKLDFGSPAAVLGNLGSTTGLALNAETIVDTVGVAFPAGPGSVAIRAYGQGFLNARLSLSPEFSQDMSSLFASNAFGEFTQTVQRISAAGASPAQADMNALKQDVDKLGTLIRASMKSFIKPDGKTSVKKLELDTANAAVGTLAFTYAQPVPLRLAQLPESELSLGVTGKLLGSVAQMVPAAGQLGAMPVPGGSAQAKLSPLGGGVGARLSLDIDKEVTELDQAIRDFQAEQNLATSAGLVSKSAALVNSGLGKSNIAFTSLTPDAIGASLDLGASMKLNRHWRLGASLINPLPLWGATRSTYTYDFSGESIQVKERSERLALNYDGAPFMSRLGAAFTPEGLGPAVLTRDLLVSMGLTMPIIAKSPASVHLGIEKLVGPIALRLGTQQLGLTPLYTAGLGLQTPFFQMNLGAGLDSPSSALRSASLALSLGAGF